MDAVIRYRHYRPAEAGLFFDGRELFSRSSRLHANCPGQPDTIRVWFKEAAEVGTNVRYIATVAIELNQCGRMNELTHRLGFRKTAEGFYRKSLQFKFKEGCRTIDLLECVLTAIDKVMGELPVLLYATPRAKQVRDYLAFMLSAAPRLRHWEIVELENWADGMAKNGVAQFGTLDDIDVGSFNMLRLPGGGWAAWIDGDELVPVLPDELQAYAFMKERLLLYGGVRTKERERTTFLKLRI